MAVWGGLVWALQGHWANAWGIAEICAHIGRQALKNWVSKDAVFDVWELVLL